MKISKSFTRIQKGVQCALPYLGVAITIFVYIVTGAAMGYFISLESMRLGASPLGSKFLGYGLGYSTQLTRGYIVFSDLQSFDYLKPGFRVPIVFAFLLGAYTCLEAYLLRPDIAISIIGLIVSGFIVEYLLLTAIISNTRYEAYNSGSLPGIADYYKSIRGFNDFMDALEEDQTELLHGGVNPEPKRPTLPLPELTDVLQDAIKAYNLTGQEAKDIKGLKSLGVTDSALIDLCRLMNEKRLKGFPLELMDNGKGH